MKRSVVPFSIALAFGAVVISLPVLADNDNVLSTPPMHPGNTMKCIAANIGKAPINLLIQLYDENGSVPFSETCQLPPGAINFGGNQCAVLDGAPRAGWCKFTVTYGKKENVRAAICSIDVELGFGAAPSCLPAR